jgi:Sulfotransferase domain
MSLKVIGAGYGRTGTMSLYTALNQLGLPCYHMMEVFQHREHLDFWYDVANTPTGSQHDWEKVFANYAAAVDNPACCEWRELAAAYPDAKVILTLHPRGPDAWYESTIDTIYFTENRWQFRVLKLTSSFFRKFGDMSRKLIWVRSHGDTMPDRAKAIARYQQHIEEVKAALPPDRLLIYTVDQGWEPLCKFIGLAVPATPFPNVNDRAQIKQTIANMTRGAYGIIGCALLSAAILIGLAIKFL